MALNLCAARTPSLWVTGHFLLSRFLKIVSANGIFVETPGCKCCDLGRINALAAEKIAFGIGLAQVQ